MLMLRPRCFAILLLGSGLFLVLFLMDPSRAPAPDDHAETGPGGAAALPLYFEANRGQFDDAVRFRARVAGYTAFLTDEAAVLIFADRSTPDMRKPRQALPVHTVARPDPVITMRLVGGLKPERVDGLDPLPGRVHYLIGDDPARWRRGVPTYARIRYRNVYPGIDLIYHGDRGYLEYDFIVAPEADPERIRMVFHGMETLSIGANGDLVFHFADETLRQRSPALYQIIEGRRQPVTGRYVQRSDHQVGFDVGPYDAARPLLIDPVIEYATYYGGSVGDYAADIAVDGYVYLTGVTLSEDLPFFDAFVVKMDAEGSGLLFASYLGGHGNDNAQALALEQDGSVWITGTAGGNDFPVTAGAAQLEWGGVGTMTPLSAKSMRAPSWPIRPTRAAAAGIPATTSHWVPMAQRTSRDGPGRWIFPRPLGPSTQPKKTRSRRKPSSSNSPRAGSLTPPTSATAIRKIPIRKMKQAMLSPEYLCGRHL